MKIKLNNGMHRSCDCISCNVPCAQNINPKSKHPDLPKDSFEVAPVFENEIFDELYQKQYTRVYSIVYRMVKTPEDAEDITQETFVRAYMSFYKLDARAPVFAWLAKIATNLCIDAARKNMNVQLISLEACFIGEILEERCKRLMQTINLGANIEMEETMKLIHTVMDTLPPHYCQVLVLRGCEGLSSKEVSKIMGVSTSTVDTTLHRARKRVKHVYQQLSQLTSTD